MQLRSTTTNSSPVDSSIDSVNQSDDLVNEAANRLNSSLLPGEDGSQAKAKPASRRLTRSMSGATAKAAAATETPLARSGSSDDKWEVKEIIDKRVEDGKTQYLLKWQPTWEPAENLTDCNELLGEFNKKQVERNKLKRGGEAICDEEDEDNDEDEDEVVGQIKRKKAV